MTRALVLLLAFFLLAGCASKDAPAGSSSASTSSTPSLGVTNTTAPSAPAISAFSMSQEFVVTYASPASTRGTNFGQPNCLQISGIPAYKSGNATLTWSGGAGAASMELVVGIVNQEPLVRVQGASPLKLTFDVADMANRTLFVAAQSDPVGAVVQQTVSIGVSFQHLAANDVEFAQGTCAY